MRLALREMRRRPGRFAVATAILTLVAILLMFLGGLLDGLSAGSTGALRAQRADLVVYSGDARGSLVRSRIAPGLRRAVADAAGGARIGGLGSVQLGARITGRGPRDPVPVVLFGVEITPRGMPDRPPADGRVYADDALRADGVREGDVLRLGPARTPVAVAGFVSDSRYAGQASLWGSLETWRRVLAANRPGEAVRAGVVQALAVDAGRTGAPGLAGRIDAATGGATSTLTIDGAIAALPGFSQQRTVFNQMIGLTLVVALIVVALFFALITVERTVLYGVLKAVGASSATLLAGVVLQAVLVTATAAGLAISASVALDALIPPGAVPFEAGPRRLASSAAYLLVAALAGCAFSLRRILRVDPVTAIGGGT